LRTEERVGNKSKNKNGGKEEDIEDIRDFVSSSHIEYKWW
jgi:hypothetical protein